MLVTSHTTRKGNFGLYLKDVELFEHAELFKVLCYSDYCSNADFKSPWFALWKRKTWKDREAIGKIKECWGPVEWWCRRTVSISNCCRHRQKQGLWLLDSLTWGRSARVRVALKPWLRYDEITHAVRVRPSCQSSWSSISTGLVGTKWEDQPSSPGWDWLQIPDCARNFSISRADLLCRKPQNFGQTKQFEWWKYNMSVSLSCTECLTLKKRDDALYSLLSPLGSTPTVSL